jgi:hypothetical protein
MRSRRGESAHGDDYVMDGRVHDRYCLDGASRHDSALVQAN